MATDVLSSHAGASQYFSVNSLETLTHFCAIYFHVYHNELIYFE